MNKNVAIKIENLSKQYRLGVVGTGTLSHDLKRWWTTNILGKEDPYLKIGEVNDRAHKGQSEYVWALKDINLEIEQGDVVGIIGKNGAGKSTLLKILSRVTKPSTGSIRYKGRIASLLEVGTGFHPEMTGRENIFMNGAIMGMSRAEISRKLDEIVDFAGVERYLDTPVKRYSSGMTVRLGFSIAAHLEPDILVVDEVLAVGDAEFQKKAIGKMQDVSKGGGRTVLFVSHNLGSIKMLCNKGVLLENGFITYKGDTDHTVKEYLNSNNKSEGYAAKSEVKNKEVYISSIVVSDSNDIPKSDFLCNEPVNVLVDINANIIIDNTFRILIRIVDGFNQVLFSCEKELDEERKKYKLIINKESLVKGSYSINAIVYKPGIARYDSIDKCCDFEILNNSDAFAHLEGFDIGRVFINHQWL